MTEASAIGFVFPNYFGGVPQIVLEFINRLDFSSAHYIFAVVTGGGGHGFCFQQLQQALANKGKGLDYGKSVIGLSNYIVAWYYKLIYKTGEQQDKTLRQVEQKAISIAADITERKKDVVKDHTELFTQTFGGATTWGGRPVWVTIGERTFAASIHGMPHAGATIVDNNMDGHVCMYFVGRRSHVENDERYQSVIQQARGFFELLSGIK